MKKFRYVILSGVVIAALTLLICTKYAPVDLNIKNQDMTWNIIYKGLKNSRDFTMDDSGSSYIAFKDKIQKIDSLGKSRIIYEDSKMDIRSMEYHKGYLYIAEGTKVMRIDLNSMKPQEIVTGIPCLGDYKEVKLMIKGDNVYIAIGSATNSGVVGDDNLWLKDNKYICDISPNKLILSGDNFNGGTTGAFCPYGVKGMKDETVKSFFPGNSSIIRYDIKSSKCSLYSWGIRNIDGMDYRSDGSIFGTVGGIEPRGDRGVEGDCDYIYNFKEGIWYGWPDFSGGDPITSPKFKPSKNETLKNVILNHPTENPPGPYYQYDELSSLGDLAIDRMGILGNKDEIYFYDKNKNIIKSLRDKGLPESRIIIEKGIVTSMKFISGGLRVLDGDNGTLYDMKALQNSGALDKNRDLLYGGIIIIMALMLSIIYKVARASKEKR